ncbi:MAG: SMC-Scp complex subunit ScpB [Verrucomicrobia bacterium]|nr:SMC-Scp complex subunit ScpB [Verrucomicrobiota bacterium]
MPEKKEAQDSEATDLKTVLGAMIFASRDPLTIRSIAKVLAEVGKSNGGTDFSVLKEKDIRQALDGLEKQFEKLGLGLHLIEFSDGYRIQTDPNCGPWLKSLLQIGRQSRLSRPALETLAIIAYRQPVVRSEIEGVRGVNVDHILRTLMEGQLIKLVGRSDLPGRPLMYGTTQYFLEHFGLKEVKELPGIDALSRAEADRITAKEEQERAEKVLAESAGDEAAAPGADVSTGAEGPAAADAGAESEMDQRDDERDAGAAPGRSTQASGASTASEDRAGEVADPDEADPDEDDPDEEEDDDDDD